MKNKHKITLFLIVLLFLYVPLSAQDDPVVAQSTVSVKSVSQIVVPVEPEKPKEAGEIKTHKVWIWQETKDCLWNLAKKYYNDPWLWKVIYLANRDIIEDPRVIYPKQELIIPPLDEVDEYLSQDTEDYFTE